MKEQKKHAKLHHNRKQINLKVYADSSNYNFPATMLLLKMKIWICCRNTVKKIASELFRRLFFCGCIW